MKHALLVMLVLFASFACADELLDSVVFQGDVAHNVSGMSQSYAPELYGYFSNQTDTMMVWQPGCEDSTRTAEFTLMGSKTAEYMWLRFPESISDDSFRIDALSGSTWENVGEYIDTGFTQIVVTSIFYLPNSTSWIGDMRFRITATGAADTCNYGQFGVISAALFSSTMNYGGGGSSGSSGISGDGTQTGDMQLFKTESVPEFGTLAAFTAAIISLGIFAIRRN